MRAVVLVGGFGTRLRPLTLSVPKQMLPVGHVTMLEQVVARLGSVGVTEVVLSLGYRPDVFLEAFPDGTCAGVSLVYAQEPEPLDTAGALVGHFHAAAFPFHPIKKGRVALGDTVRTFFESGELLGVLHLLTDDRDIVGVGQSEFTRGACWVAPLQAGGRLA